MRIFQNSKNCIYWIMYALNKEKFDRISKSEADREKMSMSLIELGKLERQWQI